MSRCYSEPSSIELVETQIAQNPIRRIEIGDINIVIGGLGRFRSDAVIGLLAEDLPSGTGGAGPCFESEDGLLWALLTCGFTSEDEGPVDGAQGSVLLARYREPPRLVLCVGEITQYPVRRLEVGHIH